MGSPQPAQGQGKKVGGAPNCGKKAVAKGSILVEVRSVSAVSARRDPVAAVKVQVTNGPDKPGPKSTDRNGRAQFDGLTTGTYTVTVSVEGGLRRYYDLDPGPGPLTKVVTENKTTSYYFQLRYYMIAFVVNYNNGKPAKGIEYQLRLKKATGADNQLAAAWADHASGVTATDPYKEDYVPKGRYQLRLKIVSGAAWPKPEVLVGEEVALHANVTGFDDDTAGSFEIYDARNLTKSIYSVPAKVSKNEMKAAWTPKAADLADLKSGWIVYQAKVAKAQCLSGEAKVVSKITYDVVDKSGATMEAHIVFHFSGGGTVEADSPGGKAEVKTPWNQVLTRLSFPGTKLSRVAFDDDGGGAARKFLLP
jgi:hypothetical protein